MIRWDEIRSVFLDMDGTLLDLHFDNHFWREHVPLRYAERYDVSFQEAKAELLQRYNRVEGTMDWYCVDYWTRELGLDIELLKQEVDHLIAVHPGVTNFLQAVRVAGKRVVLVTNAHQKSLSLKMERTRLRGHFDQVVCAHDIGVPKEDAGFWGLLQSTEPFDSQSTLLVDDSAAVLRSARDYGIRFLLSVRKPDSRAAEKEDDSFPAIAGFGDILPNR